MWKWLLPLSTRRRQGPSCDCETSNFAKVRFKLKGPPRLQSSVQTDGWWRMQWRSVARADQPAEQQHWVLGLANPDIHVVDTLCTIRSDRITTAKNHKLKKKHFCTHKTFSLRHFYRQVLQTWHLPTSFSAYCKYRCENWRTLLSGYRLQSPVVWLSRSHSW